MFIHVYLVYLNIVCWMIPIPEPIPVSYTFFFFFLHSLHHF